MTSVPCLLARTALECDVDDFPRTATWCGDGSSLMAQCENRSFRVFTTCDAASLVHSNIFPQSAPIVDFAWDCPVKLLDGTDGRLRASYPIVDHRERHIAPHSLAFNLTADKLYCGFQDAIEVFDVQRPGKGERLSTTPSKKSKEGLKGIIASLAFSYTPDYYAAATLTPASHTSDNIALFNESTLGPVLSIGGVAEWERGGVTQLMFNPARSHILYAAFRRSDRLWSWDLRGNASMPLCCFLPGDDTAPNRQHLTNQKLRFDVDGTGRWLASGSHAGQIALYALDAECGEDATGQTPVRVYDAHDDAVGAVAFHPHEPILLSVSGSRHFDVDPSPAVDSESDSDSDSDSGSDVRTVKRAIQPPRPSVRDASMKLWDFREEKTSQDTL